MSQQTSTESSPKCPSCGSKSITFSKLLGPVEHFVQVQKQLSKLKRKYEGRLQAAKDGSFTEMTNEAAHDVDATRSDEEAAFDYLLDAVQDPAEIQNDYVKAKQKIIEEESGLSNQIAVVYCISCGHIIGPVQSPGQIESEIKDLAKALLQITETLGKSLEAVRKEVRLASENEATRDAKAANREAWRDVRDALE